MDKMDNKMDNQHITPRQLQILALLAQHKSNQEIANELGISVNTVPNHLRQVYAKLGVTGRAAAFAFQHPDMLPQQLPAPLSFLSGREVQIMRLVIAGKSRQEIAQVFGINVNALAQYLNRIYTKLDVANLVEALLLCQKHLTPAAEPQQQLPTDTSENHDEELWNEENPFRQVKLLNHRIAVHRAITATIYNQPGTILLAFYDVQKQRFSLPFKPTEGSRRILNFDESGWQALLQQIR